MIETKNIFQGKIISQQIELFHKGMQVAYWKENLLNYDGCWVIGNLINLPSIKNNGEILVIVKWNGQGVHAQTSVFHLKEFVMSFSPPPSELPSLFRNYIEPRRDKSGNIIPSVAKHSLDNSQWKLAIKDNLIDTDTMIDFGIEEMGDINAYKLNPFDIKTKHIAKIISKYHQA